jgi:hypothetical protein
MNLRLSLWGPEEAHSRQRRVTRHRFLSFFREQFFASGAFYAQQFLSLSQGNVGDHLTLAVTARAAEF